MLQKNAHTDDFLGVFFYTVPVVLWCMFVSQQLQVDGLRSSLHTPVLKRQHEHNSDKTSEQSSQSKVLFPVVTKYIYLSTVLKYLSFTSIYILCSYFLLHLIARDITYFFFRYNLIDIRYIDIR